MRLQQFIQTVHFFYLYLLQSHVVFLILIVLLIAADLCALCSHIMKIFELTLKLLTRVHDFAEHILMKDI